MTEESQVSLSNKNERSLYYDKFPTSLKKGDSGFDESLKDFILRRITDLNAENIDSVELVDVPEGELEGEDVKYFSARVTFSNRTMRHRAWTRRKRLFSSGVEGENDDQLDKNLSWAKVMEIDSDGKEIQDNESEKVEKKSEEETKDTQEEKTTETLIANGEVEKSECVEKEQPEENLSEENAEIKESENQDIDDGDEIQIMEHETAKEIKETDGKAPESHASEEKQVKAKKRVRVNAESIILDEEESKDGKREIDFKIEWKGAPEFQWKTIRNQDDNSKLVIDNVNPDDFGDPFLYQTIQRARKVELSCTMQPYHRSGTFENNILKKGTLSLWFGSDEMAMKQTFDGLVHVRTDRNRRLKVYIPETPSSRKMQNLLERKLGRVIEPSLSSRQLLVRSVRDGLTEEEIREQVDPLYRDDVEKIEFTQDGYKRRCLLLTFKNAEIAVRAHMRHDEIKLGVKDTSSKEKEPWCRVFYMRDIVLDSLLLRQEVRFLKAEEAREKREQERKVREEERKARLARDAEERKARQEEEAKKREEERKKREEERKQREEEKKAKAAEKQQDGGDGDDEIIVIEEVEGKGKADTSSISLSSTEADRKARKRSPSRGTRSKSPPAKKDRPTIAKADSVSQRPRTFYRGAAPGGRGNPRGGGGGGFRGRGGPAVRRGTFPSKTRGRAPSPVRPRRGAGYTGASYNGPATRNLGRQSFPPTRGGSMGRGATGSSPFQTSFGSSGGRTGGSTFARTPPSAMRDVARSAPQGGPGYGPFAQRQSQTLRPPQQSDYEISSARKQVEYQQQLLKQQELINELADQLSRQKERESYGGRTGTSGTTSSSYGSSGLYGSSTSTQAAAAGASGSAGYMSGYGSQQQSQYWQPMNRSGAGGSSSYATGSTSTYHPPAGYQRR